MRTRILVALFTSFLLLVLICSGCGASAMIKVDPMSLFEQGKNSLQDTASVQMDLTCVYKVEYSEDATEAIKDVFGNEDSPLMKIDMQMKSEKSADGQWITMISMKNKSNPLSSGLLDMYMAGSRMYIKASSGAWYYYDSKGIGDLQSSYQGMTPANVENMMAYSDSVEVVGEDRDSIDYKLVLGQKYLDFTMQQVNGVEDPLLEEGIDRVQPMMKLFEGSELQITVSKETSLLTAGKFLLRIAMADFISIGGSAFQDILSAEQIEATRGSYVIMDFAYSFSDYGKDFNIALPKEAADATPLPGLSQ